MVLTLMLTQAQTATFSPFGHGGGQELIVGRHLRAA
jgi:hypothetical protein